MENRMKVYVFVPAGPRVLTGDERDRPEFLARQDWGKTPEAQEAKSAGIGFGLQLQGVEKLPADFNPQLLNGLPYGIHANPEVITQLHLAEQQKDQGYQVEFWSQIKRWSQWNPPPEYVVFHGAGLGEIPPINEQRFNLSLEPQVWLARAKWHEGVFARIKGEGLWQVVLETLYLCNYYGPPYFTGNWLPITYLSPRVGIYKDIIRITQAAGIGSLVDFEHLEATVQSLNSKTIELQELREPHFAKPDSSPDFERYFGFTAQKDTICRAIKPVSWEALVAELGTPYYHIGGISDQVIQLKPEQAQTEYHRALKQQLKGNTYAWKLARLRRGGSHGSVEPDNSRFREMLQYVLGIREDLKRPIILVTETSNYREGKKPDEDPGYFYWARPDAMERSLHQTRLILKEELAKLND